MAGSNSEWIQRLPEIQCHLRSLGAPTLNRASLEIIFGVTTKSAQRIMKEFGATGKPLKIGRTELIDKLYEYGSEMEGPEEIERRRQFARKFVEMKRARLESPGTLIAAPSAAVLTRFEHLTDLINLQPGRITLEFQTLEEMKKKLLLLALAVGNQPDEFLERIGFNDNLLGKTGEGVAGISGEVAATQHEGQHQQSEIQGGRVVREGTAGFRL